MRKEKKEKWTLSKSWGRRREQWDFTKIHTLTKKEGKKKNPTITLK